MARKERFIIRCSGAVIRCIAFGWMTLLMASPIADDAALRKLDRISEVQLERGRLSGIFKPAQEISLLLELSAPDSAAHLPLAGFATRFCARSFCTGQIALEKLEGLVAQPWVIAASLLDSGQPGTPVGRFRRPVIIGVIDKGFYWRDPAFRNSFGSRILYLWDQTNAEGPGPAIMAAPYGTEFSQLQLQEFFTARDIVPSHFGHGFGTAHIAGGNGEVREQDAHAPFLDLGLANPLILVNTTGRDDGVLDAIAYIVHRSEQWGTAAVINLSYTRHIGPHDGTELLTRAIDATLGSRNLLVVAVGNEGRRNHYARVDLPTKSPLAFSLDDRDCGGTKAGYFAVDLEGWYDASLPLQFSLASPGHTPRAVNTDGHLEGWQMPAGNVLIDTRLVSSDGTKKGVFITIEGECQNPGEHLWELGIRLLRADSNKKFEAWVRRAVGCDVTFQTTHPESAISSLSAGHKVLSVGAWRQDAARGMFETEPYSSYGFTGDGRRKPDVLAPGTVSYGVAGLGEGLTTEGTSVSAALVTRVLAHLWELHPDLDAASLKHVFEGKILFPGTASAPTHLGDISGYQAVSLEELESMLKSAPR